uniref:Uncharacterized protein n=1 Tax=Solanum tuberosum TaxID=4113 RepID=M1DRL7_SOLTU
MDRPTVRRSNHGPWSVIMDRDLLYPTSNMNYGRPARTVIRSTVQVLSIQITLRSIPDLQFSSISVIVYGYSPSFHVIYDLASASVYYILYAHDHASRVSLGSLVLVGLVSASRG